MKFEGTKVIGVENAFIGMRLPMCKDYAEAAEKTLGTIETSQEEQRDKNLKLAKALVKADKGKVCTPNSKYLRMIHVQVAITAPLYWWKEMDQYKIGTTTDSTSTMHRLSYYPITKDCFEMDDYTPTCTSAPVWDEIIEHCEWLRKRSNAEKELAKTPNITEAEKRKLINRSQLYWKELIRILPESWLQTRMWDADYSVLRNIYCWRKNHKLIEWQKFCDWIEDLPYAQELICN